MKKVIAVAPDNTHEPDGGNFVIPPAGKGGVALSGNENSPELEAGDAPDEEEEEDDVITPEAEDETPPNDDGEPIVPPDNEETPANEPIVSSDDTTDTVAIDGVEYSREELDQIFTVGKAIHEKKKQVTGWDPFLMEADYRHKTDELAAYKRVYGDTRPVVGGNPAAVPPVLPQPVTPTKPAVDISDIHPDDIERIKRVIAAEGYVKSSDIQARDAQLRQTQYEDIKQAQLNAFTEKFPQYKRENDPGDLKWQSLLNEFSLYKLPEDPRKFGELLERAHRTVAPSKTLDPKAAAKIIAQKRMNSVAATATGSGTGAGGGTPAPSKKKSSVSAADAARWLKGFDEDDITAITS